jgi:diguanylate cyclase (GGDEF)-like protein/PAS domain S-box-containing protein
MFKKGFSSHYGSLLDKKALKGFDSKKLQKILTDLDHSVVILDKEHRIVFANRKFCNLLKLTKTEKEWLLNRQITDFYSHESATFYFKNVIKILQKKHPWWGKVNFAYKSQKKINTSCEIIPALSSQGKVTYYICWIKPMADNEQLFCGNIEESIEFFKTLFNITPNPIYIVDEEGLVLNVNDKLVKITGYSKEQLLKKTIYDLEETIKSEDQLASLVKRCARKNNNDLPGKLVCKNRQPLEVKLNLRKINMCGGSAILVYLSEESLCEKYQQEASYNIKLRNLITKITNKFSLIGIKSFDRAANSALGDLGKFARVDRCYLFKIDKDQLHITNTHEWCSKNADSEMVNLQHIPIKPFMWLLKHIRQHDYFAMDSVKDLPPSLEEAKQEFTREGIKSMLVVPLKRGNRIFGSVGFDSVERYINWNPILIQLLTDFSNFIAQALDRRETLSLQEEKKKLELILAKKLLSATEEELAFFIKNVPTPIAIFDLKKRFVAISDRWLKDFYLGSKNVIGKKFNEVFKTDSLKWENIFEKCLRGKTLSNNKDNFIKSNGDYEWIKWKAYPRKDQNNKTCGIIILAEVITEYIRQEEKIYYMMQHDSLTNLPNRQYFQEVLSETLKNKGNKKYVLVMVAIDNLDIINNYYNIFIGDKVIQVISKKLSRYLKNDCFIARFEGGQFILLFEYKNQKTLKILIKNIKRLLSQPIYVQNYKITIDINIGVCIFSTKTSTYEKLIQDIEIALQEAKKIPTEGIVYFDANLEKKYFRKMRLENDLPQAIIEAQFYLVYQALFSIRKNSIVGAEVLLRWHHPELQDVSPTEFIPLIEKTDKIIPLGYWILEEVFKNAHKIIKNQDDFIFSINLSPEQVRDRSFVSNLKKLLKRYQMPTEIIQFEITESKLLENIDDVIAMLAQIKKIGCKIAIDDFGTGHSSLERLRELPVSTLKIDKCFIDNVDTDEKSASVVKHILMLANELKIKTTVEGVEKKRQVDILMLLGCDVLQGFYYSRPVTLDKFIKEFFKN